MRCIVVPAIGALLASCTTQPPLATNPTSPSRLPALTGRPDLLSTSDVYAIIAAVRHKHGALTRVYRINIASAKEAQAFYGNPDSYERVPSPRAAEVERRGSGWQLTGYEIVTVVTD